MILIEDIIKFSKPARIGGKRTAFENDNIIASIVGDREGLYGDFIDTFELAIIDKKTGFFITRYYFPEHDDIFPYMGKDELLSFLNFIFKSGFQVQ